MKVNNLQYSTDIGLNLMSELMILHSEIFAFIEDSNKGTYILMKSLMKKISECGGFFRNSNARERRQKPHNRSV